jgi:hypothetical protein
MIQPLRKIHRRVFFLLMLVLPVFFVAGILARHRVVRSNTLPKAGRSSNRATQGPSASHAVAEGAAQ